MVELCEVTGFVLDITVFPPKLPPKVLDDVSVDALERSRPEPDWEDEPPKLRPDGVNDEDTDVGADVVEKLNPEEDLLPPKIEALALGAVDTETAASLVSTCFAGSETSLDTTVCACEGLLTPSPVVITGFVTVVGFVEGTSLVLSVRMVSLGPEKLKPKDG